MSGVAAMQSVFERLGAQIVQYNSRTSDYNGSGGVDGRRRPTSGSSMKDHTHHHGIDSSTVFEQSTPDVDRRDVLKGLGAAATVGLLGMQSQSAVAREISIETDGEPVIWQAFHMTWPEVESKIQLYADTGFDAIWLPQPSQCKLSWRHQAYDGKPGFYEDSHPVYGDLERHPPLGYQPVDLLDFESPHGTEDELRSLIQTAHDHDLEVILDCVLNHVATRDAPADRWGDAENKDQGWEEVTIPWSEYNFDESHMHDQGELGEGCSDMFSCSLLGLPDLDQSLPHVQDVHEQYLRKLADVGADGLRLDATQHVDRTHWREFYVPLFDDLDLFRMGETWHANPDWCLSFADTGMHVLDFPLYGRIVDGFEKGDLYQLSQQGEQNNGVVHHDPDAAVTFVQNHDAIAPGMKPAGTPEGPLEKAANAFVLSYPGTTHLFRDDLEDPELRDLIWIKRNLASGAVIDRHPGYGAYIYEREGNLLAGVSAVDRDITKTVQTSWSNQTLTDYSGNGPDVTTDSSGQVEITVPGKRWVMYAPPGQRDGDSGGGGGTPEFSLSKLTHPESATIGDTVTVSADVSNSGDASGSTTVELTLDGSSVQTREVTLGAGATTAVTFEVETAGLDAGGHTVAIDAAGDTVSGTVDLSEGGGDSGPSTLVSWSDPAGDDHGPGSYTDPTAGDFYENAWDITSFEITAPSSSEYRFRIEVGGGIEDPGNWGGEGGMAHQFPQIYLRDPAGGSGGTTARTSVNAELAEPWHYVVVAHGFGLAAVEDPSGSQIADVSLNVSDSWIELTVPRSAFEGDVSEMSVAPVMCAKGDTDGNVRRVNAASSDWRFGGGEGDDSTMGMNPNVLDLLTPPDVSQAAALAYDSSSYASIPLRSISSDDGPDPAPTFEVSNLQSPSTATVGDAVTVSGDITNSGDADGTTTATLSVDGSTAGTSEVTLSAGSSSTVSFEYDTTGLDAGSHTLTVSAGDDSAAGNLTLEEPATGGVTVSLSGPETMSLEETATVDVIVGGLPNGLGGVDLSVSSGGPSAVSIVDVSVPGSGGLRRTSVADDGSSCDVLVASDTSLGADAVTAASVTVAASGSGSTSLSLSVDSLGDPDGNSYEIDATSGLSIDVEGGIPPIVGAESPTDPDGDGVYEDVNGDGTTDVADVQALLDSFDGQTAQDNAAAFDFTDDGTLDVLDVIKLLNQL